MSIAESRKRLQSGDLDIPALVAASLSAIDRSQEDYFAFVEVFADEAMRTAVRLQHEWNRGRDRGPLHGIPVAVKDIFALCGRTPTAGAGFPLAAPGNSDASVIRRLRNAGAVIVGATTMHEFGFGFDQVRTRNGIDPARQPGGSSAGSAVAVALGLVEAAIGADSGGSIRIPASFNGVVGFKPSGGAVDATGAFGMSARLDSIGPLGSCVADVRILTEAIASTPSFVAQPAPRGMRLGVDVTEMALAHADVLREVGRALAILDAAGATLVPVRLPDLSRVCNALITILSRDAANLHARLLEEHRAEYTAPIVEFLEWGSMVSPGSYRAAVRDAAGIAADLDRIQNAHGLDAVLNWTTDTTAPEWGEVEAVLPSGLAAAMRLASFGMLANVTGSPAISIPIGHARDGLPVGLTLLGQARADSKLLATASAVETVLSGEER